MKLGPTARLFALVTPFALVGPSAAVHADEEMRAVRDASSRGEASRAAFDGTGESDDGSSSKLSTEEEGRAKASARKKRSEANPDKKKARAAEKDAEKTTAEKKDSPRNGSAASKKADASAASKKAPEPKPLPGKTIDFAYDAKDVKVPSRAYMGRVFVHDRVVDGKKPMPLVVFIHGLNKALIKYRWMGGGDEGDVRRIVADLIDDGKIPPVLLAAPSSIQPDAVSHDASFPVFDFDQFLELTEKSLEGVAVIEPGGGE